MRTLYRYTQAMHVVYTHLLGRCEMGLIFEYQHVGSV